MKPGHVIALLIFLVFAATNAWAVDENSANLLVGSWACKSGVCYDEEISFSIDEGIHSYNSWLHERPSAVDGTWVLDKNHLTIECCSGLTYQYTVIRVTDTELVLRDAETLDETVMSRIQSAYIPPTRPTGGPPEGGPLISAFGAINEHEYSHRNNRH